MVEPQYGVAKRRNVSAGTDVDREIDLVQSASRGVRGNADGTL